jgi:hypothetical protein
LIVLRYLILAAVGIKSRCCHALPNAPAAATCPRLADRWRTRAKIESRRDAADSTETLGHTSLNKSSPLSIARTKLKATFRNHHYANELSLSDQAPPMQRATINQLSSETALPNRSRIAECRRKSQSIVALAGFASGRAPAVREPAAFIFCLPIPPVILLVFLLVSAAIGD